MSVSRYVGPLLRALRYFWRLIRASLRRRKAGNLEMVGVTDTSVTFTWVTENETESSMSYGKTKRVEQSWKDLRPTRWHYAELGGLDPDTKYHYRVIVGNRPEKGRFKTLTKPGEYLFSFATLADLHVGAENTDTLARLAVSNINDRAVAFTIVKGDLTQHGNGPQLEQVKDILEDFKGRYFPVLGNHDMSKDESDGFTEAPFVQVFADRLPGNLTYFSFDHEDHHFVCLDSVSRKPAPADRPGVKPDGEISDDQLDWLESDLAGNDGKPTMVFLHHPATNAADASGLWPYQMGVDTGRGGSRFRQIISKHRVVGVFSGHTHRNEVTHANITGNLPYAETAASKEYPCGYNVYRVYTKGYIQTFYKTRSDESLRLSEESRGSRDIPMIDNWADVVESHYKFGLKIGKRSFVFKYGD